MIKDRGNIHSGRIHSGSKKINDPKSNLFHPRFFNKNKENKIHPRSEKKDFLEKFNLFCFFNKKNKKRFFICVGIFLILIFLLIYFLFGFSIREKEKQFSFCGDGTFNNTCSLDKSFYCEGGILFEKSSICGCGGNDYFIKEDSCSIKYKSEKIPINLTYILRGEEKNIEFFVDPGVYNYVLNVPREIIYGSELFFRSDFKQKSIDDEIQKREIMPLIKEIQNLAKDDKVEQARIAVSLVQNIPYAHSNRTRFFGKIPINHSRYPYEVLYENKGICGEKSNLLSLLLKELGYGTAIFYFSDENHEAVGIKCPFEKSFYGSGYCFIETSGPSIIGDYSIEFSNGLFLKSKPEIILVSDGISLPKKIYEYNEAKTLANIRKGNLIGFLNSWRLKSINVKYGLHGSLDGLS